VAEKHWKAIGADCAGSIDSMVELLQGTFSKAVMQRLCRPGDGLFPAPREIEFSCSCPDWASMCKHVAAVLYGIGARLDHQPELLFMLRKVDQADLVANGTILSKTRKQPAGGRVLAADDLSEMFGIDMAPQETPTRAPARVIPTRRPTVATAAALSKKTKPTRPTNVNDLAPTGERRRLTARKRQAISERMRKYWAERRAKTGTRKGS